jgi:hypothetical protein
MSRLIFAGLKRHRVTRSATVNHACTRFAVTSTAPLVARGRRFRPEVIGPLWRDGCRPAD